MLELPVSILDALKQDGRNAPAIWARIYAGTGPADECRTQGRWIGAEDPASVDDTNVDALRTPGAITLAAGAYVAPTTITDPDTEVAVMSAKIERTDKYHYKGTLGKLGGSQYGYDGVQYRILLQDTKRHRDFTATTTQIIDDITVTAKYSGSAAMITTVRLVSVQTGKQVGKSVQFTPNASITHHTLSGFAAGVIGGRRYRLEYEAAPPSTVGTQGGPPSVTVIHTCNVHLYAHPLASFPATWRIPMGNGLAAPTGGRPNYTTSGSFYRTLNIGEIPVDYGVLDISDVVPLGSTMELTLYATDSDALAATSGITGWTLVGPAKSGMAIPPNKYFRFYGALTSTAAQDQAPELLTVRARFSPEPLVFGTAGAVDDIVIYEGVQLPLPLPIQYQHSTRKVRTTYRAIKDIQGSYAELSPQLEGAMRGGMKLWLVPEPIVDSLMNMPLRNKRVDIEVGFTNVRDRVSVYTGVVEDFAFKNGVYELTLIDSFSIADVSLPAEKAGDEWAVSTSYALNDVVVHGASSYTCIQAHTSSATDEPGVGVNWATYWSVLGTVWATIDYSPATHGGTLWHLADIMLDILLNRINIPTELVNIASIEAVKAALPNRKGNRILTKPSKATKLLEELAVLLESQFVTRDGQFTLVLEPTAAAAASQIVETIKPYDCIPGSVNFRRGWKELANQLVYISGYTGDGEGTDKFTLGEVRADATSISTYDAVVQPAIKEDKWNVPPDELQLVMQSHLDKYSDGRRVFSADCIARLFALEPGDVVVFSSNQLPPSALGPFRCIVIGKGMTWLQQKTSLALLEV